MRYWRAFDRGSAAVAHAWRLREGELLAITLSDRRGLRYHLTVEKLPECNWEWVAWRANNICQAVQCGAAPSAEAAMDAAERAACGLIDPAQVITNCGSAARRAWRMITSGEQIAGCSGDRPAARQR
jgi:hypothetical protein